MRYPRELALRPSGRSVFLLAAIHSLSAAALVFSSFSTATRFGAVLLVAASLVLAVRIERRRAGQALVLRDDGRLLIRSRRGDMWEARVAAGGAVDFGWAVWLRLQPAGSAPLPRAMRRMMLMPDSVPDGAWRALRIWLRHKAAAADLSDPAAA